MWAIIASSDLDHTALVRYIVEPYDWNHSDISWLAFSKYKNLSKKSAHVCNNIHSLATSKVNPEELTNYHSYCI